MDNNEPTPKDQLEFWRALAIGLLIVVAVLCWYITALNHL